MTSVKKIMIANRQAAILSELLKMQTITKPSPKRLLVIKHGALGDIVQGFGAFASLRRGHPEAHIALLTTPPLIELVTLMPWFNEVLVDKRAGIINMSESLRMRNVMRLDWDIIVDLQCSKRTSWYFKFFVRSNTRWIGTVKGCSDLCPDFSGVNNYRRMMIASRIAGGVPAAVNLSWLLKGAAPAAINIPETYAVLVPGCSPTKPQKRWPPKKFAELAARFQTQNLRVVLVGTALDIDVIDLVQSLAPACINLCGKTSIAELARLFGSADYVVGNDTGPLFLAAASGAPTIMVMGPETDPEMSAPTGARCGWLRGNPIEQVAVGDVLERLKQLRKD